MITPTAPPTPISVKTIWRTLTRSPKIGPTSASSMAGCKAIITDITEIVTSCTAAKTKTMLMPNDRPGSAVWANTRRDSHRPRSASTASRNGVDMPKRMKALTIAGAVSSLEMGGPRPHETTTRPMTSSGRAPPADCTVAAPVAALAVVPSAGARRATAATPLSGPSTPPARSMAGVRVTTVAVPLSGASRGPSLSVTGTTWKTAPAPGGAAGRPPLAAARRPAPLTQTRLRLPGDANAGSIPLAVSRVAAAQYPAGLNPPAEQGSGRLYAAKPRRPT